MPALANQRQELFCQAIASGKSTLQAHREAGYKPSNSNSFTLRKDPKVTARISELLEKKERISEISTAKVIERTAITRIWVLSMLKENLERAMQHVAVKDADGNEIGIYQYNGAVANKAAELIGREIGMFVERIEHGRPGDFDNLSDHELLLQISQNAQLLIENQSDEEPT